MENLIAGFLALLLITFTLFAIFALTDMMLYMLEETESLQIKSQAPK